MAVVITGSPAGSWILTPAEGKPVSVVEDCAVELKDLADYTAGLTEVFEKHGSRGTWYAHASVGCLHVRPVLNLKLAEDVQRLDLRQAMRTYELIRRMDSDDERARRCLRASNTVIGSGNTEHADLLFVNAWYARILLHTPPGFP